MSDPNAQDAEPELRLAKNITVTRKPGGTSFDLSIDGEPFLWFLAGDEGADVKVSTERLPSVTVTLVAETVNVVDEAWKGRGDDVLVGHRDGAHE